MIMDVQWQIHALHQKLLENGKTKEVARPKEMIQLVVQDSKYRSEPALTEQLTNAQPQISKEQLLVQPQEVLCLFALFVPMTLYNTKEDATNFRPMQSHGMMQGQLAKQSLVSMI